MKEIRLFFEKSELQGNESQIAINESSQWMKG